MRQMLGVFAELDRKTIVLKLHAARQRRNKMGVDVKDANHSVFARGEQKIIARMMSLKSEQKNWEAIVKTLPAEHLKTRSGHNCFRATVRRIVLAQVEQ
jgi:hypothetical protein